MTKFYRTRVMLLMGLFGPFCSYGYLYREHKKIGDAAFRQFKLTSIHRLGAKFFFDALSGGDGFGFLSGGGNSISYGVLDGLKGDHGVDPVLLEEQLYNKESVIQKIINIHRLYIDRGEFAAPDAKLVALNMRYALLAVVNMLHFYVYGKDLRGQLDVFDSGGVKDAQDKVTGGRRLEKTNAINMYVTVHLVAMDLAFKAGKLREADVDVARLLFQQAILFNSFADHFLEDAFSSGHLVVNRSPLASFTNNKALHDFYSVKGSMVANRRGKSGRLTGMVRSPEVESSWLLRRSGFRSQKCSKLIRGKWWEP